MLVDLTPKGVSAPRPRSPWSAPASPPTRTRIPFDPLPPMQTSGLRVGTPAGTTRGFGPARVPPGRQAGSARSSTALRPATTTAPVEAEGPRRGPGADEALPHLQLIALMWPGRGLDHALPVLRPRRKPGEGQPPVGRRRGDPPSPAVPVVRRPLHDLRARAAARTDHPQALGPPRAVRPRQAGPLDLHRHCASGRSSPSGSSG